MKSFNDLINIRYSERDFTNELIEQESLERILDVALKVATPSGSTPLKLYILKSKEIREQLKALLQAGRDDLFNKSSGLEKEKKLRNTINYYYRYSEKILSAPLIIAVATKVESGFSKRLSSFGLDHITDISTAGLNITVGLSLQNIQLKCAELGLGCCIMTAPLSLLGENISEFSDDDFNIKSFIAIGNPKVQKQKTDPLLRGLVKDL